MVLENAKKMDVPFEDIWKKALQHAVRVAHWEAKADWREAIELTQKEWHACYEDRETEFSHAFAGLARVQDEV